MATIFRGGACAAARCFFADGRRIGTTGDYFATLNSDVLGSDPDPQKMMPRG